MCVSKDRKPAPQEALPDVLPMPSYWYQQYDGRSFVLLHQGYHQDRRAGILGELVFNP